MAFKLATILELRKRFDSAGEVNGLDFVVDIEDSGGEKITQALSVNQNDFSEVVAAGSKDKIGDSVKKKVKELYVSWAKDKKFSEKDSVSTKDPATIQTELGFNTINQIDNVVIKPSEPSAQSVGQ